MLREPAGGGGKSIEQIVGKDTFYEAMAEARFVKICVRLIVTVGEIAVK